MQGVNSEQATLYRMQQLLKRLGPVMERVIALELVDRSPHSESMRLKASLIHSLNQVEANLTNLGFTPDNKSLAASSNLKSKETNAQVTSMKLKPESCIHVDVASYHEAGHALAALHEGRYVFGLGVSLRDPGNGLCEFARRPVNPFGLINSSDSAKAAWEHTLAKTCADMRIYLAGPLAEAKVLGKPLRSLGAREDLEFCINMSGRLNHLWAYVSQFTLFTPIDAEKIMDTQRRKTRQWLAQPKVWKAIEFVAKQLSIKGRLNDKELGYIINQAGWLNDKQTPFRFL